MRLNFPEGTPIKDFMKMDDKEFDQLIPVKDVVSTPEITPEADTKVKYPNLLLKSYFTDKETIGKYRSQLELGLWTSENQSLNKTMDSIEFSLNNFKEMNLSPKEWGVLNGVFSLANKLNANEHRPFIILNNKRELFNEVLEKTVTKKRKDGTTFKDVSARELKETEEALESLTKKIQNVFIKGNRGQDKKTGKKIGFYYLRVAPLITYEQYHEVTPEEKETLTEEEFRARAKIKINIMPEILINYPNYFKMIPKHISREIRHYCPEIKKISEPMYNFIIYLHRQEHITIRRNRKKLAEDIRMTKYIEQGRYKLFNQTILKCYEIAKRSGYLMTYELDQQGKEGLVDVFHLNPDKFEHLKDRKIEAEEVNKIDYEPIK